MSERLNIKGMTVGESSPMAYEFEPARDISSVDWTHMERALQEQGKKTGEGMEAQQAYFDAVASFYILGKKVQVVTPYYMRNFEEITDPNKALSIAASLKIVGSDIGLMEDDLEKVFKHSGRKRSPVISFFLAYAAQEAVLGRGEGQGSVKPIDDWMNKALEAGREVMGLDGSIIRCWADARIAGYDTSELTPADWRAFRGELVKRRNAGEYLKMAEAARNMTILAADGVSIPKGGGLELVWNNGSPREELFDRPQQRKF